VVRLVVVDPGDVDIDAHCGDQHVDGLVVERTAREGDGLTALLGEVRRLADLGARRARRIAEPGTERPGGVDRGRHVVEHEAGTTDGLTRRRSLGVEFSQATVASSPAGPDSISSRAVVRLSRASK
jgi:hypothetical protein